MTVYRSGKAKYRAVPTKVDGIRFASKKEAARYDGLKLLERAGRIRNLELQPEYRLEVNGFLVCKYRADFRYESLEKRAWVPVVEDCKGFLTPAYRIKRKLMLAIYGVVIWES